MSNVNYNCCRVCGFYNETPPWGEEGNSPTYEICPCCGVEAGNEDYTFESVQTYRTKWITDGAKWFMPKKKPDNWNLKEQLNGIPTEWK